MNQLHRIGRIGFWACLFFLAISVPLLAQQDHNALNKQGDEAFTKGDFKTAKSFYQKSIAIQPTAWAYNGMGTCTWRGDDDVQGAIGYFRKALEIEPKHQIAKYNLAYLYMGQEDPDNALQYINLYISEIAQEDADAYYIRGRCLIMKEQPEKAIRDFDRALVLDPSLSLAYKFRGYVRLLQDDYPSSAKDYQVYVKLAPDDPIGFNNLGLNQLYLKQYDEAIANLNTALRLDPDYGTAYLNRGEALRRKGADNFCQDFKKAIALGNKTAVELHTEHCGTYTVTPVVKLAGISLEGQEKVEVSGSLLIQAEGLKPYSKFTFGVSKSKGTNLIILSTSSTSTSKSGFSVAADGTLQNTPSGIEKGTYDAFVEYTTATGEQKTLNFKLKVKN